MIETVKFWGEIPPEQRRLAELKARRAAENRRYRQTDKGRAATKAAKARYKRTKAGRDAARRYQWGRRAERPFIGVDGEGSESAYLLLRIGERVLHTGLPLSWFECFDFICDTPLDGTMVGFFFDYDVTMMCRSMPEERLRRLMTPDMRRGKNGQPLPVDVGTYQVDYRPGKEFRVRRSAGRDTRWRRISDVGSFFQCSFVKALTAWGIGNAQQLARVKAGKEMRSDFTVMTPEVIAYNATECVLLEQLMGKFSAACRGIGYLPRVWQGPGELAAAMLAAEGIPKRKQLGERIPLDLFEAANKAYYGGRFETTAVGVLPAPLYALDINSAYPDVIRSLPCLEHGEWTLDEKPVSDLYLAFGNFRTRDSSERHYLYGFPFRTSDCHIVFPGDGRGWYWSHEIDAATHQQLDVEICWSYHCRCDCTPFDWVPELYLRRKELERHSDTPAGNMGIAIKLALNSLYGKMAQSVGSAPYANPIYASLITSATRAKLYRMVHTLSDCESGKPCGSTVYYLATDGLFASANTDIGVGTALGEWSSEPIDEDILLVQPGLYLGADGTRMKTRGIPKSKVEAYAAEFYRAWQAIEAGKPPWHEDTFVQIPFHQFMGLKQSVAFNRLSEAGRWEDLPRLYGYDWSRKRDPRITESGNGHLRTFPPKGLAGKETLGYSKDIGRWLDENRPWYEKKVWGEAQPDEASYSVDQSGFRIEW